MNYDSERKSNFISISLFNQYSIGNFSNWVNGIVEFNSINFKFDPIHEKSWIINLLVKKI